jgi:hypothetical protein
MPDLTAEHFHFYEEATCYAPVTCRDCGVTKGEVRHDYLPATCTMPCTCANCGETVGMPLDHEINPLTSHCVHCGVFEYNEEYSVRMAVESTRNWLDDPTVVDSYTILNAYYVSDYGTCRCAKCIEGEDMGETYVLTVVLVEYTLDYDTYWFCDVRGVHKYYIEENDTHYMSVSYLLDYDAEFEGDELLLLYALDGSFCYDNSMLVRVPLD